MMNEIAVDYKAPDIKIADYEKLKEEIENYAEKYKDLVVTEESFKDDKSVYRDLNRIEKQLDNQRKEIKREYQKPLVEFEAKVNELKDIIAKPKLQIKQGIDFYEDELTKQRHQHRLDEIETMANSAGVSPQKIEYDPRWDNKSLTQIEFEQGVNRKIEQVLEQEKQYKEQAQVIEQQGKTLGIDPRHFIPMLDTKSLAQILKEMDEYKQQLREAVEREKQHKDVIPVEPVSRNEEIIDNKLVNRDTGEIVDEIMTFTLELTGTKSALNELRNFMDNRGITFRKVVG